MTKPETATSVYVLSIFATIGIVVAVLAVVDSIDRTGPGFAIAFTSACGLLLSSLFVQALALILSRLFAIEFYTKVLAEHSSIRLESDAMESPPKVDLHGVD